MSYVSMHYTSLEQSSKDDAQWDFVYFFIFTCIDLNCHQEKLKAVIVGLACSASLLIIFFLAFGCYFDRSMHSA